MQNRSKITLLLTGMTVALISLGLTGISFWSYAQAQGSSETSQDASGSSVNTEKVRELKEKLATKVAELRLQQKRGFAGEIAALSKNSFTLVTASGEVRVRFNEDTQVFQTGTKRIEKKPADLANGNFVSVLGFFEEADKLQQAKVIFLETKPPVHEIGKVISIDKDEGTVTVKTSKNTEQSFDYERTSAATEYAIANTPLKKSGLSRLAVGDLVQLWVKETDEAHSIVRLV
ncbi:MAG: DUF5666 domain-containing protein, partial [Patescibacteria group bacterium]